MDLFPRVPDSVMAQLKNLNAESQELKALELPEDRIKILIDVLQDNVKIDAFHKLDIQLYVWRKIFPDVEPEQFINEHIYSKGDTYEYDPAKNGQNIIKHGIAFGEVVSYSTRFGTLSVPCPDKNDGTRHVTFSDLSPGPDGNNLDLPIIGTVLEPEVYTLSILQSTDSLKARFISSRIMSRKKYKKNMSNAFKGIYTDDPKKKKAFVEKCVEIVERDLIK